MIIGRIRERYTSMGGRSKSLAKNVVLSFGVKGVSLFVALFTTPAYIAYFSNNEVLGLWFTLLSVLSWILNCDMGIGNGLRNKLVEAMSDGDEGRQRTLVTSSYAFLVAISVVVMAVVALLSGVVNWNDVFNISQEVIPRDMLLAAVATVILAVCLQMVLNLIVSILYALQLAFVSGVLNLATNVLMLCYSLVSVAIGTSGSLLNMAVAYLLAVNLPLLVTTVIVFLRIAPQLKPGLSYVDWRQAASVLRLGVAFLWLQFMAMLLNNTDSYLITLLIGNDAVVEYQLYYKIFTLASTLTGLCATSIWSAATKAQAEGDYAWLARVFRKFSAVGMLLVVFEFLLCLPLQIIFDLWLGSASIKAELVPSLTFAVFGSLYLWSSIVTSFANGLSELRIQSVLLTLGAVANIPLAILFSRLTGSYLSIVVANIIAYVPYDLGQTIWLVRYLRKKTAVECR